VPGVVCRHLVCRHLVKADGRPCSAVHNAKTKGSGIASMDDQSASTITDDDTRSAAPSPAAYAPFCATDAVQLSQQTGEWNFEVSQLTRGPFDSSGTLLAFEGVSLLDITINQTVLQRGYGPPNMVALFIPRPGTIPPFASGQLVEAGQCATLMGGEIEAVTHGGYAELDLAFDLNACRSQLEALNGDSMGVKFGTTIAAPGQTWIAEMTGRIEWLLTGVKDHGASLSNPQLRMSLSDHLLTAMTRFDPAPADIDSTTRAATANRRVAVRIAREYIHERLSNPLPLSELCRHAKLKVRTLETGFREVTGLTPIAYIRSLRLNAVRRALHDASLQQHSISAIALDNGFWHLSQFATDYRKLFGETPTNTRRRSYSAGPPQPPAAH
jgi:AraC family ethanolamine operon transcriptional activator